uniref:Uncharacterized protein n=1 Tax=Candidozyma auris TaxID=498019 RepID=A0A0L0NYT1_CANAR
MLKKIIDGDFVQIGRRVKKLLQMTAAAEGTRKGPKRHVAVLSIMCLMILMQQ